MPDLTNPSPLVMTHFELIATVAAFSAIAIALALDLWRAWTSKVRRR